MLEGFFLDAHFSALEAEAERVAESRRRARERRAAARVPVAPRRELTDDEKRRLRMLIRDCGIRNVSVSGGIADKSIHRGLEGGHLKLRTIDRINMICDIHFNK